MNTGWTPNPGKNLRQHIEHALREIAQYHYTPQRENARLALQNAIDCMEELAKVTKEQDNSDVVAIEKVGGTTIEVDMNALRKSNVDATRRYIASLRKQGVNGNKEADRLEAGLSRNA